MNFLNRIMPFALLHYSQHPTVWNADVIVGALDTILNNEDRAMPHPPRYGRAMNWMEPESPLPLLLVCNTSDFLA